MINPEPRQFRTGNIGQRRNQVSYLPNKIKSASDMHMKQKTTRRSSDVSEKNARMFESIDYWRFADPEQVNLTTNGPHQISC